MKKIFLSIFIILLALISCSKDVEPDKTDEELLNGTWTIKKAVTYKYLNGEVDAIEESISEEPYSQLKFNLDKEVIYSDPGITQPIKGKWLLNEKNLKTDLKLEPGSSTGYGTIYFFPENTILELNQTELILRSPMSQEVTHENGDKTKAYTETYLER